MFNLALLIGIYSYIIFLFGLLGLLYKPILILLTVLFVFAVVLFAGRSIGLRDFRVNLVNYIKKCTKLDVILLILILSQGLVNLMGALGPELGFDALWYHLTLPKIFLLEHGVVHIPGGLLYYSDMPKLTEMLYASVLSFGTETAAKLIHFSFGILCLIALYNLSRKFLTITFSLLVAVLFYSNLVVGWMSITAYIDLARTFFEIMVLWGFIEWQKSKDSKWLIKSAIILGLAISTKLLALGSLLIFIFLILLRSQKKNILKNLLIFCGFALAIPLPWFIFSFTHTGNFVYPFFTNTYLIKPNFSLINPLNLSDPISSLYVVFLPIALVFYKRFTKLFKIILLYVFSAVIIWYLTPQTGGGRFILPYLPAFSIVTVTTIALIKKIKLRNIFIWLIIALAMFSVFYRGAANFKYMPVVLGMESKSQFLNNHLNFLFGDFYDTDGYFTKQIKPEDKVLLYGFHNLYYVNFPFVDSSYVRKGDMFNYIAVQDGSIPNRFKFWNLIYYNKKTNVRLYSIGGTRWVY